MSRLNPICSGLGFTESPRWHDGELWFVDFFSGHVHACDLVGKVRSITTVPGMPGGLGFLPDGRALIVSQREFVLYAINSNGELQHHADLSRFARGAANELIVDGAGRAYVGHHGFDFFGGAAPAPASLLLVELNGTVREVADGLTFPNGMALTPDRGTLIVAESFAARLSSFNVRNDGSLGARRDWAVVTGHTPDGICLDAEGAVWLGSPLSATFLRVKEGGEILDRIPTVDGRWAVACALAGPEGRTLCCATAATTLEGMPKRQSTAFIEVTRVTVPGSDPV